MKMFTSDQKETSAGKDFSFFFFFFDEHSRKYLCKSPETTLTLENLSLQINETLRENKSLDKKILLHQKKINFLNFSKIYVAHGL